MLCFQQFSGRRVEFVTRIRRRSSRPPLRFGCNRLCVIYTRWRLNRLPDSSQHLTTIGELLEREREKERNFSRLAGGRSIRRYYSKKRRISLSLLSSQERDKCIYSAGPFKPYYSQDQISTRGASLTNVLAEKELHGAALPPVLHLRTMFVYLSRSFPLVYLRA